MLRLSFLLIYMVLVGAAQMPPSTTDWRGLSPLQSTRIDVERTLGPPSQNFENQLMIYYSPDAVVRFGFSSNPKCRQKLPYTSWDVPADTVTAIDVTLKHSRSVEETGIDLSNFKKTKGDYDVIGHYYYWNSDGDFGVEVNNNYVKGYLYRSGVKHKNLRCEPGSQR